MKRRAALTAIVVATVSAPFWSRNACRSARAEDTSRWTAVYVQDMHCADCANRIAKSLYKVDGVRQVKANLKRDLAFVVPDLNQEPTPGQIWRAVEKAGFKPVKLISPAGVFTKRPKT